MVLCACRQARAVAAAAGLALNAPLRAGEVGEREGVLRDVRGLAVVAEAAVVEGRLREGGQISGLYGRQGAWQLETYCVAGVDLCSTRAHILTDERACRDFTATPILYHALRQSLGWQACMISTEVSLPLVLKDTLLGSM